MSRAFDAALAFAGLVCFASFVLIGYPVPPMMGGHGFAGADRWFRKERWN